MKALPFLLILSLMTAVPVGQAGTSSNAICTENRILCVPATVRNSQVENPFRVNVQINSPDDISVRLEVRDHGGQVLESYWSADYTFNSEREKDRRPGRTLQVQAFILHATREPEGMLVLTPERYTPQEGGVDLPGMTIPVRLTTEKSTLEILRPEDEEAFKSEVSEWVESENHPPFNPVTALEPRQIEVMRFDPTATVGITAEAVLRTWPGQGPWHVTQWRKDGSVAHITYDGSGWAGVTYYLTGVSYLIEKSVLHVPGITKVVFR